MKAPAGALVVVIGGTGMQGGSVAHHLLADSHAWRIRVPTRSPDSQAAQALQQRGVEVVKADLARPEDLRTLMAGAWAVFGMTNATWDPETKPDETQQGVMLAEAAKAAGVQVCVWASQPDVERLSGGKLRHAVDCTMKARVWQTVQTMGFPVACTVEAVAYFEDQDLFPELFCFRKEEDGHISMTTLMLGAQDKMCGFSVADLGLPVVAVLRDPAPHNGKRIGFPSTFDQPISAYIQGFERVVGKPVRLHVRQPNADDAQPLVEIAAWLKGYPYYGGEAVVDAQSLVPQRLTDWEAFMIKNDWKTRFG